MVSIKGRSVVGAGRKKGKGQVTCMREKSKRRQKIREERNYCAYVYYIRQNTTSWLMHFTIVPHLHIWIKVCMYCTAFSSYDLLKHMQAVQDFYSKKGAEAGPYFSVTFDRDEVSLDIPKEGITLSSGWSILPLIYPTKVRPEAWLLSQIKGAKVQNPQHSIPCSTSAFGSMSTSTSQQIAGTNQTYPHFACAIGNVCAHKIKCDVDKHYKRTITFTTYVHQKIAMQTLKNATKQNSGCLLMKLKAGDVQVS